MAAPFKIYEDPYSQEHAGFALNKATPPDKEIQLPLTPPTTSDRFLYRSTRSAVDSAIQIFRQHQDHTLTRPWTSISITPREYQRFLFQLKRYTALLTHVDNKIRFDYDPASVLLSVRMPSPVHDFFTAAVTGEISKQLEVIGRSGDSCADFAARIANGGCARIFLKEDTPDEENQSTRVFHRREPDGQFQHRDAEYPGVVLEISYSQDGKDLKKLAWDYIQYSNGDIKVVIGIDIRYSNTKEATLSVWRPRYIHEDGEELDLLEAEETVVSESFRAADGSLHNSANCLCLSLDDFATDEIPAKTDPTHPRDIVLPYKLLAEFLNDAEERQEAREPRHGSLSQSFKSTRQTRKRKRTSSPLDQLRSEDEADHLKEEAMAEERINAEDSDFTSGTLAEPYIDQPRRSNRQRV